MFRHQQVFDAAFKLCTGTGKSPTKVQITKEDVTAGDNHRQFSNPELPGYVGFANLPNQVHRKSVKRGFEFTLMVVGESGLGKSTLISSLFQTDLYPERHVPNAADKLKSTVSIEASTVEIEERGVKLRLTVVDTPGFADALNNNDCFKTIISYIDNQYEKYLQDESGLNRRHIVDNRVHCCFYFINPAGHGLKPLDIAFMKAVHHKVNIVPVIAKADTLTKNEVLKLKRKVLDQIADNSIQIYPLPDCDSDEDEDYKVQCKQLKLAVPFAVVGSNATIEIRGKKMRGRVYPWGVVEVENPDHCDFIKLRTMLITHMQDLQEVTHDVHYENFRAQCLANGTDPRSRQNTHMQDMQDVTQEVHYENFRAQKLATGAPPKSFPVNKPHRAEADKEVKLTEKERELQAKEAELKRMQEMINKMQAEMAQGGRRPGAPAPAPPTTAPRTHALNGHPPQANIAK